MVPWWWSWLLMSLNLTAMILAGRHFWWGWLVGVLAECFWFYYGYMTQQWGFAFFAILFGAVYLRNTFKWRKKEIESRSVL